MPNIEELLSALERLVHVFSEPIQSGISKSRPEICYVRSELENEKIVDMYSTLYDAASQYELSFGRDEKGQEHKGPIDSLQRLLADADKIGFKDDISSLNEHSGKITAMKTQLRQNILSAYAAVEFQAGYNVLRSVLGKEQADRLSQEEIMQTFPDVIEGNKDRFIFYNIRNNTNKKLGELRILPASCGQSLQF
jgi:hypothetical protein